MISESHCIQEVVDHICVPFLEKFESGQIVLMAHYDSLIGLGLRDTQKSQSEDGSWIIASLDLSCHNPAALKQTQVRVEQLV